MDDDEETHEGEDWLGLVEADLRPDGNIRALLPRPRVAQLVQAFAEIDGMKVMHRRIFNDGKDRL